MKSKKSQTKRGYAMRKGVALLLFLPMAIVACAGSPHCEESEGWSKPVNGLQARLVIKNRPKVNGTDILDVILEVRNVSIKPIAIQNDRHAISFRLLDSKGTPVRHAGLSRSGPVPYPQWGIIPGDAYLGFSLYAWTVGIPRNAGTLIALPKDDWLVKKGEYTLGATFSVEGKSDDAPDNAWTGRIVLPQVSVKISD